MPRARQHLSLNALWDLEDQYTALAGSASGRTVAVPRAQTAAVPATKIVSPKRISRTEKLVHAVTEGIKTGLAKTGIYKMTVKTHGTTASKTKKPKFAAAAQSKAKIR